MRRCKTCYDTGYITTLDTRFDKDVVERCDHCNRYSNDYLAQKAEIRKREHIITYDQWERLYRPVSDGDWYKDYHPYATLSSADKASFDRAQAEKRLWTEIVDGDSFTVIPGIAWVNRSAFYITEKPCRLNLMVEDPLDIQALKVSAVDARELLMMLDQDDYPFDDIWAEKDVYLDVSTVDNYRPQMERLCQKYHRPLPDAIELSWN